LTADFGLSRISAANREGFSAAVEAVIRHLGERAEVNEAHGFEASDWWYVPIGFIGCAGHIVEKQTGVIRQLGSSHSLDLCFWAQVRGLLREGCTLVIDRIHDRETARRLIRQRWRKPDELLATIPVRIEMQHLWFELPLLREAERTGAFTFHVE
jgi:hypothetical protein